MLCKPNYDEHAVTVAYINANAVNIWDGYADSHPHRYSHAVKFAVFSPRFVL
jgi:hypothetical protein